MPLRSLIVDDEAPARSRLRRLLAPFVAAGRLAEPDEAADGVEALQTMQDAAVPYDLVFLDVRMPELDGFDVLDRLRPDHRPAVIFTTAYDEYALRAFEASAVDYLLKPVDTERLGAAVARAEALRRPVPSTEAPAETPVEAHAETPDARVDRLADLLERLDRLDTPASAQPAAEAPLRQFTVQGVDRLFVVDADDLVAAVVADGITNLHVRAPGAAMHRYIVSFTLDALEARLDPARTMRVHRGALVRLGAVREMIPWFSGRYKLVLDGGLEVVASRARSRDLRDRLAL